MLFVDYFKELKLRFIYILISFIFNCFLFFNFSQELLFILIKPLLAINSDKTFNYFIFTHMSDVLLVYIKIAFFFAIFCMIPVIFLQCLFFLIDGLYNYEKNFFIFVFVILFFLIFYISFLLYFYIIPFIWFFFINFELSLSNFLFGVYYEARITDYIGLIFSIFFIFISLFILPILMVFLLYFNILKISFFIRYRKYFFILFFIFGGVFSPPDIISQVILGLFIIFFYEVILFFNLFFYNYIKL